MRRRRRRSCDRRQSGLSGDLEDGGGLHVLGLDELEEVGGDKSRKADGMIRGKGGSRPSYFGSIQADPSATSSQHTRRNHQPGLLCLAAFSPDKQNGAKSRHGERL